MLRETFAPREVQVVVHVLKSYGISSIGQLLASISHTILGYTSYFFRLLTAIVSDYPISSNIWIIWIGYNSNSPRKIDSNLGLDRFYKGSKKGINWIYLDSIIANFM